MPRFLRSIHDSHPHRKKTTQWLQFHPHASYGRSPNGILCHGGRPPVGPHHVAEDLEAIVIVGAALDVAEMMVECGWVGGSEINTMYP